MEDVQKLVSVCLITYNHEKYIAQAIDSILKQQTSFDFELIIADDNSSDGTRSIIQQYQKQYPEKIRLILQARNNIIENFLDLLRAARYKYVAYLDGDDFWTDNHKLQKQVNYLESHEDCAGVLHETCRVDETGNVVKQTLWDKPLPRVIYQQDMFTSDNIGHTSSFVFRQKCIAVMPPFFIKFPYDRVLFFLVADYGYWACINEVMSAYRAHGGGVFSQQKTERQITQLIEVNKALLSWPPYKQKYKWQIRTTLARLYRDRAEIYSAENKKLNYVWDVLMAAKNVKSLKDSIKYVASAFIKYRGND